VVALYRTGRRTRSTRTAVATVLLATLIPSASVVLNQRLAVNQAVLTVAFAFFMSAAPAAIGALVTTRQDLTTSLAETDRAREAELEAREATARASERARTAREIHDAVGHHATLIAVESAALAANTAEQHAKDTELRVRALAKETLAEMRAALGLLNTAENLAEAYHDLPHLIARARAAGLHVHFDDRACPPTSPVAGRAIYRVVQEALTNITKHAPDTTVHISLTSHPRTIHVAVTNTAPTTRTPHNDGTGLHGPSERMILLGGTFTAAPTPDGGFTAEAKLPTGITKVGQEASTCGGSAGIPANA
jgi:signal transduction histidine kinase